MSSMHMDPVEIFRQEAEELFLQLETALLDLEGSPEDKETIDSAFRALHTIKGSGAMCGFEAVEKFTHQVETVFDRVRNGEVKITPGLIGVTLAAKDHMRQLIEAPSSVAPGVGDAILADLNQVIRDGGQSSKSASPEPLSVKPLPPSPTPAPPPLPTTGYRIRFALPPDALLIGTNPVLMIREMLALGEGRVRADASAVPPLDTMDPEHCYLSWELTLTTDVPVDTIEDVFLFVRNETDLTIEPLGGPLLSPRDELDVLPSMTSTSSPATDDGALPAPPPAAGALRPSTGSRSLGEGVVKVNADRIDSLMNQVGELVIAQSRLKQISQSAEELSLLNLRAIVEEIGRLISEMRETTMGIRMVPIGSLFGRFRRVVRDLSRELGKNVQLAAHGEETELDKTVVESLNDPLVHLIRNAIDHGIESAAERLAAGKPAEGSMKLTASHVGGQVLITVSDDGRGLNPERIKEKAVERGLIAADAEVADADLFALIFQPGFSTASSVTSVSGRGVGMDVVKKTIDGLRGRIDVTSRRGEGCNIVLLLPLTLAIIDGMLVRVGAGRYIVPLSAVDEIVELSETESDRTETNNFLFIRDALVPFLHLRELFSVTGEAPPYEKVIIVRAGERRVGLVVDQILGDHQTVIKSLSRLHADVKCFSGATILGDGRVALILDIIHLIDFGQSREERLRNS